MPVPVAVPDSTRPTFSRKRSVRDSAIGLDAARVSSSPRCLWRQYRVAVPMSVSTCWPITEVLVSSLPVMPMRPPARMWLASLSTD